MTLASQRIPQTLSPSYSNRNCKLASLEKQQKDIV